MSACQHCGRLIRLDFGRWRHRKTRLATCRLAWNRALAATYAEPAPKEEK